MHTELDLFLAEDQSGEFPEAELIKELNGLLLAIGHVPTHLVAEIVSRDVEIWVSEDDESEE